MDGLKSYVLQIRIHNKIYSVLAAMNQDSFLAWEIFDINVSM